MKTLIFTCGDINGIGPEIVIKTINKIFDPVKRKIIFISPANVFEHTSSIINPKFNFRIVKLNEINKEHSNIVEVVDIGNSKQNLGIPTKSSGFTSAKAIELSYQIAKETKDSAIITSPISKIALQMAGIEFPGQTEFYAHLSNCKKFLMVFLSRKMITALLTIHEPIKKISELITKKRIETTIEIFEESLQNDLGILRPEIAILGLNPHSGEDGKMGEEELNVIIPSLKSMKKNNVSGPYVPDAFFGSQKYKEFDATLGMFHDQVLIPFKMLNFDKGVNFTAGLPIIRVSPDHGTAYDISDLGIANPGSMITSANWAERIIKNRNRNAKS